MNSTTNKKLKDLKHNKLLTLTTILLSISTVISSALNIVCTYRLNVCFNLFLSTFIMKELALCDRASLNHHNNCAEIILCYIYE